MACEQIVMSFMELTNVQMDEARRYVTAAENILEVAIQNFYDAQQGGDEEPQLSHSEPQEYDDDVPAPLPREFSQLVEEESVRSAQLNRVKRQYASGFRDLKKETEIQEDLARGITPKRLRLEDIYRNPIDITFNLDLYSAKHVGEKHGKWIALLINDENFPSLCFNRDIFNSDRRQKVKQLIKKNFVFLRKNSSSEESIRILQNYKLTKQSIPVFLIIDSLTGELRKNFGDTKDLTLKSVVRELKKYTSNDDKDLKYSSDGIEDSDDDDYYSSTVFTGSSSSNIASQSSTASASSKISSQKSQTAVVESDSDESFASLHSEDVSDIDEEQEDTKDTKDPADPADKKNDSKETTKGKK